eukprot:g3943.t1
MPKLVSILLLLSLPLVYGGAFQHFVPEEASSNCKYEFEDYLYDLTPLRKAPEFEKAWLGKGEGAHQYWLNVCSDVSFAALPSECLALGKSHPSPGFHTSHGQCHWLGKLENQSWKVLDPESPEKGLELFYDGGPPCKNGLSRGHRIKYHFICAGAHGTSSDGPVSVVQKEERCETEVIWPTFSACPKYSQSAHGKRLLRFVAMAIVIYAVARTVYNMIFYNLRGVDACPRPFVPLTRFLLSLIGTISAYICKNVKLKREDFTFGDPDYVKRETGFMSNVIQRLLERFQGGGEHSSEYRAVNTHNTEDDTNDSSSVSILKEETKVHKEDNAVKSKSDEKIFASDMNDRFPMTKSLPSPAEKGISALASGLKSALDQEMNDVNMDDTDDTGSDEEKGRSDSSYDRCDNIDDDDDVDAMMDEPAFGTSLDDDLLDLVDNDYDM